MIIAQFLELKELLRLNCTFRKAYDIIVPQVMDQRGMKVYSSLFSKMFSPDHFDMINVSEAISSPFNLRSWPDAPDYSDAFTVEEDSVR